MHWLYLFVPLLFLCGCSEYGSHSHYIISHDEVEQKPQSVSQSLK